MNFANVKIVSDSSSDIIVLSAISYEAAPLKIITSDKEYVDNESLNVLEMVNDLQAYKGKSSTSCPNAADWLRAFGDAEQIFCVTITGTLSGSYNSAMLAKAEYEQAHPNRRVFVLDSLSTGPEMALIIERLEEMILQGLAFEEICEQITAYAKSTQLIFMLESMKNLANNGRVKPIVAKMAGLLGIRVVGRAGERGDLDPLNKCRGEKKTLETIVEQMRAIGMKGGRVRIAHCFNESAAKALAELIRAKFGEVQIKLYPCRGLCSFYAEKGGLLVGFERA